MNCVPARAAQEGIEAAVRIRFEGAYDSERVKPTRCASTLPLFGAPYWRGPVRRRLRQARLNLVEDFWKEIVYTDARGYC